jgi:hypothetical protein
METSGDNNEELFLVRSAQECCKQDKYNEWDEASIDIAEKRGQFRSKENGGIFSTVGNRYQKTCEDLYRRRQCVRARARVGEWGSDL